MTGNSRITAVLSAPVISEKSTECADKQRTIVFRVLPDARKDEIKRAVEKLFEVKVKKVRVMNVRGKMVYRMRHAGTRASWKKAYVLLVQGSDINFSELQ